MDQDKKIVNTEEQNRAVNPGDTSMPEDSPSQEAAHDPSIDAPREKQDRERDRKPVLSDMDDDNVPNPDERSEGDDLDKLNREIP